MFCCILDEMQVDNFKFTSSQLFNGWIMRKNRSLGMGMEMEMGMGMGI